jgi:hypothetical protein
MTDSNKTTLDTLLSRDGVSTRLQLRHLAVSVSDGALSCRAELKRRVHHELHRLSAGALDLEDVDVNASVDDAVDWTRDELVDWSAEVGAATCGC